MSIIGSGDNDGVVGLRGPEAASDDCAGMAVTTYGVADTGGNAISAPRQQHRTGSSITTRIPCSAFH
jgi:hypothetical protein